jgi:membrane protein
MCLKFKDLGKVLKTTLTAWIDKDPFRQSATVAYYAIFSLPALLVIIIAVSGFFFGEAAISGQIFNQVSDIMGPDTAEQVEIMVIKASSSSRSVWATVLGLIVLLFGATGVFAELQTSLNNVWSVKSSPKKGNKILLFLRARLFSFGLILSIGFLMLMSLVVDSLLAATSDYLRSYWADGVIITFYVINFVVSIGITSILFALMFKFLPDAKIKWSCVWGGAIIAALLFTLGKYLLGFYFGKAQPESNYGAAGSIVLIMLWASYSSLILFFGAEFTKATSDLYFGDVKPGKYGVKVVEQIIEEKA